MAMTLMMGLWLLLMMMVGVEVAMMTTTATTMRMTTMLTMLIALSVNMGAGGDNGTGKIGTRREISVSSCDDQSHYLHPHPYGAVSLQKKRVFLALLSISAPLQSTCVCVCAPAGAAHGHGVEAGPPDGVPLRGAGRGRAHWLADVLARGGQRWPNQDAVGSHVPSPRHNSHDSHNSHNQNPGLAELYLRVAILPMLIVNLMALSRYWSAMTMSTVGYGKEPGSKEGQILCSVLSLVGAPIFVAVPAGIVSRAFPSCTRSILTDIYLCHAWSGHEIKDGNARPGRGGLHGDAGQRAAGAAAQGAAGQLGGSVWALQRGEKQTHHARARAERTAPLN
eukprot:COSAG01_NODE_9957_length_2292_cov_7.086183_2_plen_336_part_00